MRWHPHDELDQALQSEDGVFDVTTDPVYGYLVLRLCEDPCQSLGEFATLKEVDTYLSKNRHRFPAPDPDVSHNLASFCPV